MNSVICFMKHILNLKHSLQCKGFFSCAFFISLHRISFSHLCLFPLRIFSFSSVSTNTIFLCLFSHSSQTTLYWHPYYNYTVSSFSLFYASSINLSHSCQTFTILGRFNSFTCINGYKLQSSLTLIPLLQTFSNKYIIFAMFVSVLICSGCTGIYFLCQTHLMNVQTVSSCSFWSPKSQVGIRRNNYITVR